MQRILGGYALDPSLVTLPRPASHISILYVQIFDESSRHEFPHLPARLGQVVAARPCRLVVNCCLRYCATVSDQLAESSPIIYVRQTKRGGSIWNHPVVTLALRIVLILKDGHDIDVTEPTLAVRGSVTQDALLHETKRLIQHLGARVNRKHVQ